MICLGMHITDSSVVHVDYFVSSYAFRTMPWHFYIRLPLPFRYMRNHIGW